VKLHKNSNPRLLDLLRMGCRITLPDADDRYLQGLVDTGYIQIGNGLVGKLGLWCLDRQGLRNALTDRDFQPQSGE
jgi:hypothetical protein